MIDVTSASAPPAGLEEATDGQPDAGWTSGQTGAISFPELVRAHFDWERGGCAEGELEQRYRAKLALFQEQEGPVMYAYWATQRPSAVALTMRERHWLVSLLNDRDAVIRLHRVTDWLAREAPVAELLHHCDTLAIRVSEVLRGTSERIAMQWIYSVESHLLGLIERTRGKPDPKDIRAAVETQTQEVLQIERYYARAAGKAARIVYFWGMMIGVVFAAVMGFALAFVLWQTGWFDHPHTLRTETFFVCYIASGLGAVVSVLMRMSSNRFKIDYEVGRATIRRLGSFRPFIGVVFGMALYFLFRSGISKTNLPPQQSTTFFFFGILAFLSGFNERWTNVLLGKAELTLASSLGGAAQASGAGDEDEEEV
jgi:hypothetical protein